MTPPPDGSCCPLGPSDMPAAYPLGPSDKPAAIAIRDASADSAIPAYLRAVYTWAYITPTNVRLLDRPSVVAVILFGNYPRLRRTLLSEIEPGQRVFQAAHVYGNFIPDLAKKVGSTGHLDVIDVVPLQVTRCRTKLRGLAHTRVRLADASEPGDGDYDAVCSFFLLHEIPDDVKCAVVDALLARTKPGGKAIFVDYHQPSRWHPLRGLMRYVNRRLEPFAESLWHHDIRTFASDANAFRWQKQTFFGGLYQKTVAHRL